MKTMIKWLFSNISKQYHDISFYIINISFGLFLLMAIVSLL